MSPETLDAIDNARANGCYGKEDWGREPRRPISRGRVISFLRSFAEEMPSGMTLGDLAEELSNNENQRSPW